MSSITSPSPASCGPRAKGLALRSSSLARSARRVPQPAGHSPSCNTVDGEKSRPWRARATSPGISLPRLGEGFSSSKHSKIAKLRIHQSNHCQALGRSPVHLSSPARQSLISTSGCWLDRVEVGGFPRDASTHRPTVVARDCCSGLRRGPPARPPRGRPPATLPLDYLYLRRSVTVPQTTTYHGAKLRQHSLQRTTTPIWERATSRKTTGGMGAPPHRDRNSTATAQLGRGIEVSTNQAGSHPRLLRCVRSVGFPAAERTHRPPTRRPSTPPPSTVNPAINSKQIQSC